MRQVFNNYKLFLIDTDRDKELDKKSTSSREEGSKAPGKKV